MKIKHIIYFLLTTIFIFSGCSSSKPIYLSDSINYNHSFPPKSSYDYDITKNITYSKLYDALYSQFLEWKGVQYKYGGNTKKGIDCSAFVQKTFRDKLHKKIPRTTKYQSSFGKEISMNELQMGDLIFFKTGFNTRHVGIYLEGGRFLHASTNFGVIISHLDNPYYQASFWKVQRVLY
jgi:cell wall-associated NlpC family hydrolase